jgi:hypothetical protein
MEPISELKNTLTEDLKTWGDIWTVRMMGRIGNKAFVPNLIHVLRNSEAYDLALQRWEDENNDMDSYELFAGCLRGIGNPRGIEKLQYVYANENDATYIGDDLECLSIIHNVDIPEMSDILRKRKEQDERQKARKKELNELAANYKKNTEQRPYKNGRRVVPPKRNSPKVGRNEPCPCGSGKKYKKCCLNSICLSRIYCYSCSILFSV